MGICHSDALQEEAPPSSATNSENKRPIAKGGGSGTIEDDFQAAEFEIIDTLISIPFFDELEKRQLKELGSIFTRKNYAAGEVVIWEGKHENAFNVIVNGQVRISAKTPKGEEIELALLGKGQWFGDITVIQDNLQATSATAVEKSTILSIPLQELQEALVKHPDLSIAVTAIGRVPPVRVQLRSIPFFADVPEPKLQQLSTMVEFRKCKAGEVICRQGDEADGFFYIVEGHVNISAAGADGAAVHLDALSAGNWFGEIALLENVRRTATVTTTQNCVLLYIDREKFNRFLRLAPEIQQSNVFQRLILKRTANSLKAIPLFSMYRTKWIGPLQQFDESKLTLLGELFKFVAFSNGDYVFREGDDANAFFIVIKGQCRVTAANPENKTVDLGTLEVNDWFGETALLRLTSKCSFSVMALGDCVMLRLREENFHKFLQIAPEMEERLRERIAMRTAARLREIPFFFGIKENKPWSKLDLLGGLFVFEEKAAGDVIFTQGSLGDKFYIIVEGKCTVAIVRGKNELTIDRLQSGQWFGEIALLRNVPRTAQVTCETACLLLSITSNQFRKFLEIAPELTEPFESLVNLRTANALRSLDLFKQVKENKPWNKMELIAALFSYRQVAANQVIYTFGDAPDWFYLLVQGQVRVTGRSGEGDLIDMGIIHEQGHFGEVALLKKEPRETMVTALRHCIFMCLNYEQFKRLLSIAPELKSYFLKGQNAVDVLGIHRELSLQGVALNFDDADDKDTTEKAEQKQN